MSKRWRLLLGVVLLAAVAWWTDWTRVVENFARMNWGYWLAAVGVYAATQYVSSLRWMMFARAMGFSGRAGRFVTLYYVGMFFNLMLPTAVGGDVVRAWYLARGEPAGRGVAAFTSVFIDRVSGLLMLLALACVAVVFCPPEVAAWMPWTVWGLTAGAVAALTAMVLLPRIPSPLRWFPKLNARVSSVGDRLVAASAVVLKDPWLMLNTTALSLLVQLTNVAVVWLVGLGLGVEAPMSYYLAFVPVVALMTMLPVSVSGMGVREGLTVLLLAPVGVPEGTAFSLAFLWFLAQAATSLGGVAFYIGGRMTPPAIDPSVEGAEHGPVGDHPGQGREGQPASAPRAPHRLPAAAESQLRTGPRR